MTRQQLSDAWIKRGAAWDAIVRAETAILELRLIAPELEVDNVKGALAGARELLVLVTERIHAKAAALPGARRPTPEERNRG